MTWLRNISAFLFIALFMVSLSLNVRHYVTRSSYDTVSDTTRVTVVDTVSYDMPVPRDSVVIRTITQILPVVCDTAATEQRDSVVVELPISQTRYDDSLYTAYVSGYHARLDSLILYPRTQMMTISSTSAPSGQKRWGIGIQAGYGIILDGSPALAPYIGIGVTYNLFNF